MTFAKTFRRGDRIVCENGVDGVVARGSFVRYNLDDDRCVVDIDVLGQRIVPTSTVSHAPVVVVGPVPAKPPTHCPQCGAETYVDVDAETVENGRRRKAMVVACGFCDFIEEVKK